jgi:hypothetical protein
MLKKNANKRIYNIQQIFHRDGDRNDNRHAAGSKMACIHVYRDIHHQHGDNDRRGRG